MQFLQLVFKGGEWIEISWPRTWEMENVNVESFTFSHFSSWYQIPGDAFSLWTLHYVDILNFSTRKLVFAGRSYTYNSNTQIPKFADISDDEFCANLIFGRIIFGFCLHQNASQRHETYEAENFGICQHFLWSSKVVKNFVIWQHFLDKKTMVPNFRKHCFGILLILLISNMLHFPLV